MRQDPRERLLAGPPLAGEGARLAQVVQLQPLESLHAHRVQAAAQPLGAARRSKVRLPVPELKGSIGEGPNQTNFSDRSSVRILGIERKPRKTTSSKWHATQNTRRGRRKGLQPAAPEKKQTASRQRGGLRSRSNSNDAILAIKRCNACLHKRICLPSKYDRSALRSVERRIES